MCCKGENCPAFIKNITIWVVIKMCDTIDWPKLNIVDFISKHKQSPFYQTPVLV